MRSKADEISIWRSVLLFKRAGCIAMIAAFCAALDGYRKTPLWHDSQVMKINADIARAQKSTSMAVSSQIRALSSSSLRLGRL